MGCPQPAIRHGGVATGDTKGKAAGHMAEHHFFATISRMKYIDRWALMRNARQENLSEHTLEVAMIAHALCTIGNVRYGRNLDAEKAALVGLYHDASEIITGDMPTPVKYQGDEIQQAYKRVEQGAVETLLAKLPDDLRPTYEAIFAVSDDEDDVYLHRLVKAADKISALVKCIEERNAGNSEFDTARTSIEAILDGMDLPEVRDFLDEFLPSYGKTLDELLSSVDAQ